MQAIPHLKIELVLQDRLQNVLYIVYYYIDINLIHVVILSEFCPMWMAWPWWSDHRLGDRGSRKCTVPDCLTFSAWQISTLSSRKRGETWRPTSRPYLSRLFLRQTCIRLMWVWMWIEQVRASNTSSKRPEIPSTVHWKVLNVTRLQRWQQTTAVHQFAEAGWANSSVLFSISANFSISARDVLKICGQKWRCVFHAPQRPSRWELGPCRQVCRCSLTTISQSHHAPGSDGLLAQQRSLLRDGDGKHFPQRCSARFPQVTWESDPNHSTSFHILHFHQVGDCTLGWAIAQWLHLWKYGRQRRKSHGNATPEGCRDTWNGSCLAGD